MELLTTILARAKEPSTWASLAGMLMLAHCLHNGSSRTVRW